MTNSTLPTPLSQEWRGIAARSSSRKTAPGGLSEVILLIDASGSMSNTLEQAGRGAIDFARKASGQGWSVGLVIFNDSSTFACKPTKNPEAIASALPRVASGGTAMHSAMAQTIQHLKDIKGHRSICIVSDGVPDDRGAALASAREARAAGIDVLVIAVDGADSSFLSQLATRPELARPASVKSLPSAMASMAGLLRNPVVPLRLQGRKPPS